MYFLSATCALLLSLLLTLAGCPAWAEDEIVTGPDRRHEIDLRIAELEAERAEISLTGPKVATFGGLGMLALGAVVFTVVFADEDNWHNDAQPPIGALSAGGVLMFVGAVTGVAGGVVWGKRSGRRNEIEAKRDSLIEQRDGMAGALSTLQIGSEYRDDTHFVKVGFRF